MEQKCFTLTSKEKKKIYKITKEIEHISHLVNSLPLN